MPLQNRVLATGDIVADAARGMFMGNRGILHGDKRDLGRSRWKHKAWVTCVLKHRDWHRTVMKPGRYTELFFLDEAVALAAGHRPCSMCRHSDYVAFRAAAGLTGAAGEMDAQMHDERAVARRFEQRRHMQDVAQLPDGAVFLDDTPKLIWEGAAYPVTVSGYGDASSLPAGEVTILTPPTSLAALAAWYKPTLHPSLS